MTEFHTPTVLLPGGGGAAAVCALKSLRMAGFQGRIISTDTDPLSAGLHLADGHATLPRVTEPDFFDRALEVIKQEKVTLILPTSGFDILVYSRKKSHLENLGVKVIMSDYPTIENCIDKWQFYQITRHAFPMPHTTLDPGDRGCFPCFVKPIQGKGSRGAVRCGNASELEHQMAHRSDLLIQEYLPGEEFSIDVLSDLKGQPLVAVPRVRLATKDGISFKGRIVADPEIQDHCMQLAYFLKLKGPSCMQMKRGEDGRAKFVEVNPRMGGGTIFTTLAGINIASLSIAIACGQAVTIPPFHEITVLRYYEEITLNGKGAQ